MQEILDTSFITDEQQSLTIENETNDGNTEVEKEVEKEDMDSIDVYIENSK